MEIPDNLASELESKLSSLMEIGHDNDRFEWSTCGFCDADSENSNYYAKTKPIVHAPNCLGVSLQRLFEVD